ncbi:MAG: efflux RND transporter periplasmic adaptor subunit [Rubrivivax sp.]|nr:efflux RND transporter periplasmic adaptor subunit [Rubrivivax sp.]MDP3613401.1 efflux RND transporter periplasmic adaptor subunit [Rubrivivax sp.]
MISSRHLKLLSVAAALAAAAAAIALRAGAAPSPAQLPAAQPALTVSTVRPQTTVLPARIRANGSVAAWQEASIGSEASGLRLASVLVNVGDVVRRGQVLARFVPDTVQATLAQLNASLAEAEASAADAAANAERARSLAHSGALSEQQINQYLTAEQMAKARVQAQRAAVRLQALRLAQTEVSAPDDGVISARLATPGAVTPAGQELFRLIRGARLEWRAEVTPEEAARLRPGMAVQVADASGAAIAGRVRLVAPTVDPRTRSALVYVDLPPSNGFKAGMFATGEFEFGESMALTVPEAALAMRDGFPVVFRVQADGRVEQVRVRVARRHVNRVEVLEGITAQAEVVASGAAFLNDGDTVKLATPARESLAAVR